MQFSNLNWAIEQLGAGAIVYPGNGQRDHASAAIQFISDHAPERRTFTHTGWREVDAQWAYLHANRAIGTLSNIEVRLADPLSRYTLPDPPDGAELIEVVRTSIQFLNVAPEQITFPIYGAVFRAALGSADFSLHIGGATGAGKSEIVALAQQHYGPSLDARHLPGSWSSTGDALEGLAFIGKDALLVVDDFCPAGGSADVQRYQREADRFLQAQGNASGRQRMQSVPSVPITHFGGLFAESRSWEWATLLGHFRCFRPESVPGIGPKKCSGSRCVRDAKRAFVDKWATWDTFYR